MLALFFSLVQYARPQQTLPRPKPDTSRIEALQLSPAIATQLKEAISAHRYTTAEKLLLPAITQCREKARKVRLLEFIGGIYYLDSDYLHAAVAWNKSAAIAPLPPTLQFSLAMAYIQLHRLDWARKSLQSLAGQYPKNALYPYWLGRLDYVSHRYDKAIRRFQQSIKLAPGMAQAYNNLGLCYYYLNQNTKAIRNYKKAIQLNIQSGHPSAWPYLNLAITQQFLNQLTAAETNLKESIRLNPKLPSAYFYLGNILEHQGKLRPALLEYQHSVRLDKTYPQPHFALARVYRRLGEKNLAHTQVQLYLKLRREQASSHSPHSGEN